jgi:hypothetical protein
MILGSPRSYALAGDILAVKLEPDWDLFPDAAILAGHRIMNRKSLQGMLKISEIIPMRDRYGKSSGSCAVTRLSIYRLVK